MSESLSTGQQSILANFREIAGVNDEQLCIQVLQSNNWNLETAINNFVNEPSAAAQPPASSSRSISSRGRPTPRPLQQQQQNDNNNRPQTLFDVILNPLKWVFQSAPMSLNPDADTAKFVDQFNRAYGDNHPAFHEGSYNSAVAEAFRTHKMLLMYLHSPFHDDTNEFCRKIMCSQNMMNLASQNVLVWIGKVWDPEAYSLSAQFQVVSYPFTAVVVCQSNRAVQVVDRIQGYVPEGEYFDRLRNVVAASSSVVNRQRESLARRAEATRMRQQQDAEYQESLEADRRERERREREEREAAAEEERRQQEAELAEAIALSERLTAEDNTRKRRDRLGPEPDANSTTAAVVRFQLPQGKKITRRFEKSDSAVAIYDFLTIYFTDNPSTADDGSSKVISHFSVCTHFPKQDVADSDEATVDSLGLYPRGMLYVVDDDA